MVAWIAWKNKPSVCILSISEQLIVFRGLTLLLRFLKIAGMQCPSPMLNNRNNYRGIQCDKIIQPATAANQK
jgi:hypothetical protein